MGFWSDPFGSQQKIREAREFVELARKEIQERPSLRAPTLDNISYATEMVGTWFTDASNANIARDLQAAESHRTFSVATLIAVVLIGVIIYRG